MTMSDELEEKILSIATVAVSEGLQDGEAVMATKVVMLVTYIDPKGIPTDAFFHAGDPRYSEIFGLLRPHTLRVEKWFQDGIAEQEVEDDND